MDYYIVIFQTQQNNRWVNDEYYGPFNTRQAAEKWTRGSEFSDLDPCRERFILQYLKPVS
jgi:hypothetical protein